MPRQPSRNVFAVQSEMHFLCLVGLSGFPPGRVTGSPVLQVRELGETSGRPHAWPWARGLSSFSGRRSPAPRGAVTCRGAATQGNCNGRARPPPMPHRLVTGQAGATSPLPREVAFWVVLLWRGHEGGSVWGRAEATPGARWTLLLKGQEAPPPPPLSSSFSGVARVRHRPSRCC